MWRPGKAKYYRWGFKILRANRECHSKIESKLTYTIYTRLRQGGLFAGRLVSGQVAGRILAAWGSGRIRGVRGVFQIRGGENVGLLQSDPKPDRHRPDIASVNKGRSVRRPDTAVRALESTYSPLGWSNAGRLSVGQGDRRASNDRGDCSIPTAWAFFFSKRVYKANGGPYIARWSLVGSVKIQMSALRFMGRALKAANWAVFRGITLVSPQPKTNTP